MATLAGWLGWLLVLIAILMGAACASTPEPTPSSSPAVEPPGIRSASDHSYTASEDVWTFFASVDTKGAPTRVVLEYSPTGNRNALDQRASLPEPVTKSGAVSIDVTTSAQPGICWRWSASNPAGTASSPIECSAIVDPSRVRQIVVPSPSG